MENHVHNAAGISPEDQEHNAANTPPSNIIISCETEFKGYKFNEKVDIYSLVTLIAPCQVETDDIRAPIDLVFVIDRSGSMAGQKLELVKKTLQFVLTQLNEKDRLAVVSYDDKVCVEFGLCNMTKQNKDFASSKINGIKQRGMTNLCGGLLKGMCQMIDRTICNEVASVLLFTDGLANTGISNAKGIVEAMKDPKRFDGPTSTGTTRSAPNVSLNQAQQAPRHQSWLSNVFGRNLNKNTQQQIPTPQPTQAEPEPPLNATTSDAKNSEMTVYTFGFGVDHDPEMLKQISDAGNGMYYFIENEDKIGESFAHCLGGLMSTVAQGIQLCIDLTDGVSLKEVHTLKPFEKVNDKSVKINIGDLQSEEKRDVVLELTLDPVPQPYSVTPQKIWNARTDYFNVLTNTMEIAEGDLFALRPEDMEIPAIEVNPNQVVRKQKARVRMAKAVKISTEQADLGDYEVARANLQSEIANLRIENDQARSLDPNDDFYNVMSEDVNQCYEAMADDSFYKAKGAKLQRNVMQQYNMQRQSNLNSRGFETGAKKKKRAAALTFMKKK